MMGIIQNCSGSSAVAEAPEVVLRQDHDRGLVVRVEHNVVKIAGAIFFGPGNIFGH